MARRHAVPALAVLLALMGSGCPTEEEEVPKTGIEVIPPETVDFGTIYECTQAFADLRIVNHGPDDEDIDVDVDTLIPQGFVVTGFVPTMTLPAGDEYALAIGVSPGPGGAGIRDGSIFITTQDRVIIILVQVEIIEGNEC